MNPSLSSVRVDIAGVGVRAVGMLLAAIEDKNAHQRRQEVLRTVVALRRSTCGAGPVDQEARHAERTYPPVPSPPKGAKP